MAQLKFVEQMLEGYTPPFNLYLYHTSASPSLTSSISCGDLVINVDSNAGVSNGHAINIHDDNKHYQSIVLSSTATTLTLASPLVCNFGTDSVVHTGPWNCAVDGSVTPVSFQIHPPDNLTYDIVTIIISITHDVAMDSAKFGGLAALTNGIILRKQDGEHLNFALIVNNIGMTEQGFDIEYDPKAPAGVYGLRAKNNIKTVTGTPLRLTGAGEEFQVLVQDDLTDLAHMSVTVSGHIVD